MEMGFRLSRSQPGPFSFVVVGFGTGCFGGVLALLRWWRALGYRLVRRGIGGKRGVVDGRSDVRVAEVKHLRAQHCLRRVGVDELVMDAAGGRTEVYWQAGGCCCCACL